MVCEKVKQLVCQYPTLLNVCPTLFHPKHLKKLLMGVETTFTRVQIVLHSGTLGVSLKIS